MPPFENVREEYKVLEQFLDEGRPMINPYEAHLLCQGQECDRPMDTDPYNLKGNKQNNHRMAEWSVFGTQMHYVNHPSQNQSGLLLNKCENKIEQGILNKVDSPQMMKLVEADQKLIENFTDRFEEVVHHLHMTETFSDSRDIATTYLGKDNLSLTDSHYAECAFPIYSNSHTWGQLLGGGPMDILLDSGASKCYMSKEFYKNNPCLHHLPKYRSNVLNLRVGSGQLIPAHFLIPVIFKVLNHKFEIFALVSDIENTTDLVFGVKNMFEIEGELSCRNSEFRFLNRAVPLFCFENFALKTGCKRYVKVSAPFIQELTGHAIAKIFHGRQCATIQIKLHRNIAVIDMVNTSQTTMFFTKEKALGIVDIRSLGFYNIKHCVLEYNLSACYEFANFNKIATAYEDMKWAKYQWKLQEEKQKKDKKQVKEPDKFKVDPEDPYPWLPENDKRRHMSDEEIIEQFVDLSKSDLTEEEKEELIQICKEHIDAFSLRDEIGECPNIRIDIDVIDDSPFFVRPFPISEEDKPIMDWQMKRLVCLGVLKQETASHTSPVFLIARKVTFDPKVDKRPLVDFRLLNTRVKRQNTATPLLRDIYQILGASESDILSCVDLKDAFHSLRLTEKAKDFCGILPYFGSPHYRYEVMPMGLSISPCKWIEYIGYVMDNMTHKQNFIAIMDDLLVHSKKEDHLDRIVDLFKALIKHGLKLSPKKCHFFRDELVYMGNVFKVRNGKFVITPIKTRVEAIQNTPTPKTAKECKSFCGVVNYLSLFCPNLQKLLAPIYDLTKKGKPFLWSKAHQESFDNIKSLLIKPPVLNLPDGSGRYTLYSDTSKTHAGSALWQMQKGQNKLVGYGSKSLPKACENYGITELEMTGLLVNMENWKFYLGRKDFDAAVDHRAIPYIMKSKELPTTDRIIRILQRLARFNFHLYYVKGKDMILCDFLSRIKSDNSDPHNLIPIAFHQLELYPVQYNPKQMLDTFYNFQELGQFLTLQEKPRVENYLIMTRSAAQESGSIVPKVHGADKPLDPNLKPEKDTGMQKHILSQPTNIKPVGPMATVTGQKPLTPYLPRSVPQIRLPVKVAPHTPLSPPNHIPPPTNIPQTVRQIRPINVTTPTINKIPVSVPRIQMLPSTPIKGTMLTPKRNLQFTPQSVDVNRVKQEPSSGIQEFSVHPDQLDPEPIHRQQTHFLHPSFQAPQPTQIRQAQVQDLKGDPWLDPHLEAPLEESSVESMFRSPMKEDFIIPPTLGETLKNKTLLAKNLPKQTDIDRLMKVLNRKILTHSRFPEPMKDLEASYLHSGVFKDIYEYIRYNRLPTNQTKAKQTQINSINYFTIGSLLFRLIPDKTGELNPVLCLPPTKMDLILDYYHSSLLGGHQGMNKTLVTLQQRFFCPRMADYVRSYIIGCHICQLFKHGKRFCKPFQQRKYDLNEGTMTNISMDIKYMPNSENGYNYILVMLCEISNFMVTAPLYTATSPEVCKALQDHLFCVFGTPVKLICDQDPAFMSHLTQTMLQSYGTKLITVSPTNHKSLLAEHGIKSLANIMMKHLTGLGTDWDIYCKPAMLVYNSYASPNLADISPFELVFGRKANICPEFEFKPQVPITGTHRQALEILQKKLRYFRQYLQKFRNERHALMNRDKEYHGYTAGQIVYLYFPGSSMLNTGSKKIRCEFIGPLAIWKCVSPTQFLLMSLDGKLYPYLIEETRIKPGFIRTTKGNVTHMSGLRQVIKSGELLEEKQNVLGSK